MPSRVYQEGDSYQGVVVRPAGQIGIKTTNACPRIAYCFGGKYLKNNEQVRV